MSYSLDSVGPALGPNCLQRLSAVDTTQQKVKAPITTKVVCFRHLLEYFNIYLTNKSSLIWIHTVFSPTYISQIM